MSEILQHLEDRRVGTGLLQRDVAAALGITQPHYSKLVGGLVTLTPQMHEKIERWLDQIEPDMDAGVRGIAKSLDTNGVEVRQLVRGLEAQVRSLKRLLNERGSGPGGRPPRLARSRQPSR